MFDISTKAGPRPPIRFDGQRPAETEAEAPAQRDRIDWCALMLDELDQGVLLLDAELQLRQANHAARREIDEQHPLRLAGSTLIARRPQDQERLQAALLDAVHRGRRRLMEFEAGARRIAVSIVPLRPGGGGAGAVQVMLGRQQMCCPLTLQCFASAHLLTAAETRVLEALCAGASPHEAASRHGVGIATIRTQIGSIRAKTGCTGIGALLRRVAALPPVMCALREPAPADRPALAA